MDRITVDGVNSEDPDGVKHEAVNFFRKIFKEEQHPRPTFSDLGFNTLSREQAQALTEKFSHEEIDQAVASCDGSKAPGPDGFQL